MKISKRKYVTVFYAVVVALAVIKEPLLGCCDSTETNEAVVTDTVQNVPAVVAEIGEKPHKIGYVPPYKTTFPDSQQVQLAAAERLGVRPVANRADAEARKRSWFILPQVLIIM